jgi:hypothetical protein
MIPFGLVLSGLECHVCQWRHDFVVPITKGHGQGINSWPNFLGAMDFYSDDGVLS